MAIRREVFRGVLNIPLEMVLGKGENLATLEHTSKMLFRLLGRT